MANRDRIERFTSIKTRLGPTFEQRPSPHDILHQQLVDEQALLLRITNIGQPWSLISKTLTTVAGQSEYEITQPVSASQDSGKVHYVIRTTDDENLPYLSVPFADISQAEYGKLPSEADINSNWLVPERISFYRRDSAAQTQYAVIHPTPQDVMTYTIWYFVGAPDRTAIDMASAGPIAELSDWLDLQTTLALLPGAKWSEDREINNDERKNRERGLDRQLARWEPVVNTYLQNVNGGQSFDIGYWND